MKVVGKMSVSFLFIKKQQERTEQIILVHVKLRIARTLGRTRLSAHVWVECTHPEEN